MDLSRLEVEKRESHSLISSCEAERRAHPVNLTVTERQASILGGKSALSHSRDEYSYHLARH